jgi:predicted DNA-binding transcriptional regulator AlpA
VEAATEERRLLSLAGVSEWLGISPATVHRLRNRDHDPLPLLKVGNSVKADPVRVQEWLDRQTSSGGKWEPRW